MLRKSMHFINIFFIWLKARNSHAKDNIFHETIFHWFMLHFSHNFSNWISNLKLNMTHNKIKIQFFLHQALDHSQIYIFTLFHDYKFKTYNNALKCLSIEI
jgi:hypothetical protein